MAYAKMVGASLPEKTATYTPISHTSIMNRIRSEITSAGYIITGEDFRSTNDGQIGIGVFKMNYKSDPDIELSANFVNSYNKQYAFRFSLGGIVKASNNSMLLNNSKFGAYKRVHKGSADLLAEGRISAFIRDSELYWNSLVEHKEKMKDVLLTSTVKHDILGELFFQKKVLNTLQLNAIRSEMNKPSFDYRVHDDSAWALYNHIVLSLKDSHPSDWMNDQTTVHEVFANMLGLEVESKSELEESVFEFPELRPEPVEAEELFPF